MYNTAHAQFRYKTDARLNRALVPNLNVWETCQSAKKYNSFSAKTFPHFTPTMLPLKIFNADQEYDALYVLDLFPHLPLHK